MKAKFLAWLFFIILFQSVSTSAHDGMVTAKRDGYELSKHLLGGNQLQDAGEKQVIGLKRESEGRRHGGGDEVVQVSKIKKGKGPTGGSNVVHRPPRTSGATSFRARPPSSMIISTSLLQVCFGPVLVIFFHI